MGWRVCIIVSDGGGKGGREGGKEGKGEPFSMGAA